MGPSRVPVTAAAAATAGKKQADLKPPGYKRLLVIFSAVAYVLFLGVPLWWHTTSLHRPPLPHEAMQQVALEASSSSAYLPVSLQLVVAFPQGQGHLVAPELAAGFHASLQAAAAAALPHTVNLSVALNAAEGSCYHHPPAAAAASAGCTVDWPAGAAHTTNSDDRQQQQQQQLLLDDWLQQQQGQGQGGHDNAPGHYRLYLLPSVAAEGSATAADGVQAETGHTLVVGRHRHAWLMYEPGHSATQMQELQALAAAAAVRALSCCFALHAGQTGFTSAGSLPISPAGRTHLSLSLLNADPAAGSHYTWDMEQWEAQHLAPIAASLAPVSQISFESQVLQYTAARLPGKWSAKHGAYVVKGSQLPFFIDSEWPLESGRAVTPQLGAGMGVSPALTGAAGGAVAAGSGSEAGGQAAGMKGAALVAPHVLQFLVYIPSQQRQPLQLLGHGGHSRDSNSFVIPSWGGLMVLNPDRDSSRNSRDTGADSDSDSDSDSITDDNSSSNTVKSQAAAVPLTAEQYSNITAVLIAQLQALFGVAPLEGSNSSGGSGQQGQPGTTLKVEHLPGGRRGFSCWQMDALLRQRSAHDVREAARVLAALSTLVQELPNLEMPDLISEQVTGALSEIDKAWQRTAAGDYLAAAAAATAAHAAAEAAFSHPAVLAQLNFPESHKLGVYMPLFLPLCVPLIQGLMGQLKHLSERRRVYALSVASR